MKNAFPPGPSGSRLYGSLLEFRRDRLGFLSRLARDYGDVVPFRVKRKMALFVNDPKLIEVVVSERASDYSKDYLAEFFHPAVRQHLLFSDADSWLDQRRLAAPAFRPDRMPGYCDVMAAQAEHASRLWRDGDCLDIPVHMRRITLDVLTRSLFRVELGDMAAEGAEIIDAVLADVGERAFDRFYLPVVPTPRNVRLWARIARGQRMVDRLIAARRRQQDGDGDLLTTLVEARGADGRTLSNDQIKLAAVPLLFAGHETTASALSWTLFLLSRHPQVEERLMAEVDSVIDVRLPEMSDAQRLTYTGCVVHEALRLYPPIWGFGRVALKDTELGEYAVQAGTIVFASQWVLHRDSRYFERPDDFEPDRWTDGIMSRLPKCAYMPFGAGPRRCLGSAFAMLEAVLVLATLYRRFRFSAVDREEPRMEPLITLRPKGLRLRVELRD